MHISLFFNNNQQLNLEALFLRQEMNTLNDLQAPGAAVVPLSLAASRAQQQWRWRAASIEKLKFKVIMDDD